jgi:uncharacterized NAD-dependent epimerase/dehydratase family protein
MPRRIVVLTEGLLDVFSAKTAVGVIRYCPTEVVAVLDSTRAGQDLEKLVGTGKGVPIIASLKDALKLKPDTFLIGIAPPGGQLPPAWRAVLREALENRLNIVSGLHQALNADAEFAALAKKSGATIWDVRVPTRKYPVAMERARGTKAKRVLTVGTDCNLGKKLAALEITASLKESKIDAAFLATGQTGIMISGKGIPLDNVISDFVAGAAETLVCENGDHRVLLVEGQGGLLNSMYGGVTLGLMQGTLPHAMIMVHAPTRKTIRHLQTPIPPLPEVIDLHERIMKPIFPTKVIGMALNTFGMQEPAARQAVEDVKTLTGLPTTDVIRFGADPLAEAVRTFFGW